MSERAERKKWESFRKDWGRFTCYFKQHWQQRQGKPPLPKHITSYQESRRELTSPLGEPQQRDFDDVADIPAGFEAELDRIAREDDEKDEGPSLFDTLEPSEQPLDARAHAGDGNSAAREAGLELWQKPITITKRYDWEMGHRLPAHDGKCNRLHGHHYVAEIDVTGTLVDRGSSEGMVVDFYVVKDALVHCIGRMWDHRMMLHDHDPVFASQDNDLYWGIVRVPFMPTAENIALEILRLLRAYGLNITRVRVYETPDGWAEVKL